MSNMVLVKPLVPSALAVSSGTGGTNVITADPKEVWACAAGGSPADFDFDLGALISVDSIFIGFIGGAATAPQFSWTSGTASYTATTNLSSVSAFAASSAAAPVRRHAFRRLAAPVVHRYHRITFAPNVAGTTTVGIIALGLAFAPTHNREWGSGRQVIDTGVKEPLLGGGFGVGEGARKASFRWTLGDLTDADVAALYALALDRGETAPLVAVEDPGDATDLNEGIHYGLFDRFEAFERQNPQQTRWSLSLTEWV